MHRPYASLTENSNCDDLLCKLNGQNYGNISNYHTILGMAILVNLLASNNILVPLILVSDIYRFQVY